MQFVFLVVFLVFLIIVSTDFSICTAFLAVWVQALKELRLCLLVAELPAAGEWTA